MLVGWKRRCVVFQVLEIALGGMANVAWSRVQGARIEACAITGSFRDWPLAAAFKARDGFQLVPASVSTSERGMEHVRASAHAGVSPMQDCG